jgi:adenylate cyclase
LANRIALFAGSALCNRFQSDHLHVLGLRAAALAQLGRSGEAAKAAEVLQLSFPGLTVERHLKNFRWKVPADIAHYRDGLLKAGVPFNKAALAASGSRFAADS